MKTLLQASARDVPEWMKYSTVHPSGDPAQDPASSTTQFTEAAKTDAPSQSGESYTKCRVSKYCECTFKCPLHTKCASKNSL